MTTTIRKAIFNPPLPRRRIPSRYWRRASHFGLLTLLGLLIGLNNVLHPGLMYTLVSVASLWAACYLTVFLAPFINRDWE